MSFLHRRETRWASAVLAGIAVMATVALPVMAESATTGNGDWIMLGDGPAHNSVNRAESTLSPSTVSGLRLLHTYKNWTEFGLQAPTSLVVGSVGYGADTQDPNTSKRSVTAFGLPNGTDLWQRSLGSIAWNYVPAVSGGILYVGGDGALWALKATTGALIWKTLVSSQFNATTVAGSVVYASTASGIVYAVNATNGHILWSTKPSGCCLIGTVSVSNGLAYVVSDHLSAYNATTGALVFSDAVKVMDAPITTAVVSGGVAFVQGTDTVYAFNASTGGLLWTSATGHVSNPRAPAVDGSTVVVGAGGSLVALSASDGHQLWILNSGSPTADYRTPAIANGVVYAGSFGNGPLAIGLQAVNETTGKVLFTGRGSCLPAIVSHGSVYVECGTGMRQYGL